MATPTSKEIERPGPPAWVASFGPFRLSATQRLLEKDGVPVHLGGRALDLLIALVDSASQVISKKDLMARVWPTAVVEEGSLRVHMVEVRRVLGEGISGARYVANVPGRGYCFVASVSRSQPASRPATAPRADRPHGLPTPMTRMVGRETDVQLIESDLLKRRFLTIVGPGGIGKTTVAVAAARAMLPTFEGAARFIDLAAVTDEVLVPSTIASTLGLVVHSVDAASSIVNFLHDKRMLLVLDSCEHVIDVVARLAERIFKEAPDVHLLATSRESLRVEGEQIHRLLPLACPPADETLKAEQALAYPAVQLFAQRAGSGAARFELSDADAPAVAGICRGLDGIALAIELAAGGLDAYGVEGIAALLDRRFRLLRHGRRTAVPRHQTMSATLDWSYNLLPEIERAVLRCLSVFVGAFSLEAAQSVAGQNDVDEGDVVQAIVSLVAKSLLTVDVGGNAIRYRLLDSTRGYVMDKLIECGESDAVASRHASHYRAALEGGRVRKPGAPIARTLSQHTDILGNVRAALEWSLSARGHEELGTALAAAAAPLLLEMSLPSECRGWMERALSSLDESTRGTRREMELQVSLGESLMFTRGDSEQVRNAFSRGLELAETLGEPGFQLRVLGWLDSSLIRSGEFRGALEVGRRAEALAAQMDNPVALQMANAMLGGSLHLVGDIKGSEKHWRAALTDTGESHLISAARLGFDHRVHALCGQARNHWLMGCCDQAATVARCAIEQAESLGHPLTLCLALIWAGYVFLWRGDLSQEEDIVDRLSEYAAKHSLKPYQSVAVGLRGEVHVKRGRPELGIKHLRDGLQAARVDHYESRNVTLINSLAVGLNDTGRHAEAKAAIEEAMTLIERNGGALHMPETLRIKAEILISTPGTDPQLAEQCLFDAIECARRQSALSWELRATSSLARLLLKQDRIDAARQLLAPVYGRFAEGHNTDDLVAAKDLLVELGHLPR